MATPRTSPSRHRNAPAYEQSGDLAVISRRTRTIAQAHTDPPMTRAWSEMTTQMPQSCTVLCSKDSLPAHTLEATDNVRERWGIVAVQFNIF